MDSTRAWPSLEKLLKPKSIAVVGASARTETYGRMLLDMLIEHNFSGPIYPINPRYPELAGLTCDPDLDSLPEPVDLAYIALPSAAVVDVVEKAGQIGVGGVVVPGAGFAEGGASGTALQAELVETAAKYGIAICGPNNMGYINYHERTACWVTHVPEIDAPGDVALITQSGSVGIAISQDGRELKLGYLIGAGNEANVGAADYLDFFVRDDRINVVLLFIETLREPERFAEVAAEARRRNKRIAVVKVGRSVTSSRMVAAHTGAIAGEDGVYDAFFRKHGILRATDLDELVELGMLLSSTRQPPPLTSLGVVTLSGGEAALIADLSSDLGLQIPDFEPVTVERLRDAFPAYATPRNPVDAYGLGWDAERFAQILEAVVADPRIGVVVLAMDTSAHGGGDDGMVPQMARICADLKTRTDKPFIYINNTSGSGLDGAARRAFETASIPVLVGMREGLAAIAQWASVPGSRSPEPSESILPGWGARAIACEHEADRLALLTDVGVRMIETTVVNSADEAWTQVHKLGRAVMKGTAPSLLHKTEHGLVALGLSDEQTVRDVYQRFVEALVEATPAGEEHQMLVQPMLDEGVELILGAHHHEGFGTVIAVGLGGTLVEVIKQASLRLAPVQRSDAMQMLEETPAATLLKGTRGKGPFDLEAVCDAIVAFSVFAAATQGQLRAVEVNPLLALAQGQGVRGLDAVFED